MSESEVKRFFGDMANDTGLKSGAESAGGGLAGIATYASGKGYTVTADDLQAVATQGKDLSEDDLEKLAGGIGVSVGCVVCISS